MQFHLVVRCAARRISYAVHNSTYSILLFRRIRSVRFLPTPRLGSAASTRRAREVRCWTLRRRLRGRLRGRVDLSHGTPDSLVRQGLAVDEHPLHAGREVCFGAGANRDRGTGADLVLHFVLRSGDRLRCPTTMFGVNERFLEKRPRRPRTRNAASAAPSRRKEPFRTARR